MPLSRAAALPCADDFHQILMNAGSGSAGLYIPAQKAEIHEVLQDREDTVGNNETRKVAVNRSRESGNFAVG